VPSITTGTSKALLAMIEWGLVVEDNDQAEDRHRRDEQGG
jgi:hypothetical protein